jgi:hypothetical protein
MLPWKEGGGASITHSRESRAEAVLLTIKQSKARWGPQLVEAVLLTTWMLSEQGVTLELASLKHALKASR